MKQTILLTAIIDLSVYALLGLLYCIGFFDVTPTHETLAIITFAMQKDDSICRTFRSTVLSTNYEVYNHLNATNLLTHIAYENLIINEGQYESGMSLAVLSLLLRGGCDFISLLILSWSEWVKYGKGHRHKAHIHELIGHSTCSRHADAYRTKLKILHHIIRVEQLILVWLSMSSILMIFLLVTEWNNMTAGSSSGSSSGISSISNSSISTDIIHGNANPNNMTNIKIIDLVDLVDIFIQPTHTGTLNNSSNSYNQYNQYHQYHSSAAVKYRITLTYEDNPIKFLVIVSILFFMHLLILLLLHSRKRHEQKTYSQHIELFDHDTHYYRKHLFTTLVIHFVAFVGTLVAYLLGDLTVLLQAEQSLTIIIICTYLLDVVVGIIRLYQVYRKREKFKVAWRKDLWRMVGECEQLKREGLKEARERETTRETRKAKKVIADREPEEQILLISQ